MFFIKINISFFVWNTKREMLSLYPENAEYIRVVLGFSCIYCQLPLDVCCSVMKNKSGIDPFYLPELSWCRNLTWRYGKTLAAFIAPFEYRSQKNQKQTNNKNKKKNSTAKVFWFLRAFLFFFFFPWIKFHISWWRIMTCSQCFFRQIENLLCSSILTVF